MCCGGPCPWGGSVYEKAMGVLAVTAGQEVAERPGWAEDKECLTRLYGD